MKIQLKLMILTLALFSFANAAHLVDHATLAPDPRPDPVRKAGAMSDDDGIAIIESALSPKKGALLEEVKEDLVATEPTDREKLCQIRGDLFTIGADLWDFGVRGAAREIKRGCDWVLHEENLDKAAKLYNTGKNKAFEMYSKVTITVPCWLFWSSVALATDAVTTEFVIESFPVAVGIGALSCYGASYLSPFISQKPAINLRAEQCREELRRLYEIKAAMLKSKESKESKESGDDSGDEDDAARKVIPGLVVDKAKDISEDVSELVDDCSAAVVLKKKLDEGGELQL